MARAKSNASKKYARNYRKISTRRMTTDDPNDSINVNTKDDDNQGGTDGTDGATGEEVEMERLRSQLRCSNAHLSRYDGGRSLIGKTGGSEVVGAVDDGVDAGNERKGADDGGEGDGDGDTDGKDSNGADVKMTNAGIGGSDDGDDVEADEMERLRNKLRSSTAHLSLYNTITTRGGKLIDTKNDTDDDDDDDD